MSDAAKDFRSFENSTVRHGTASGWSAHQQRGEQPCDPCWRAKSEYDKRRLATQSEATRRNRLYARAQQRARSALAANHRDEYRALYEAFKAELEAEGGAA